ncbi:MAG: 3'(2'),5'-bisphosphate nucleotidase CysQ [Nitrospirales bacterium]|nr:3'(2'),5'-bisphosphate nucleotidase CysQ [Nitrospirales bacterium]
MQEFSQEITVASRLAREAGAIIMNIYHAPFAVHFKSPGDPVTEADQKANALIVSGLHHAFPNDLIVAEESDRPSGDLLHGRVWYVDPLDGTREFIQKNGEFSVMIGLAIDGQSYLGVVYRPDRQLLYGGIADCEAWVEEHGERQSLGLLSIPKTDTLRLAISRSHRHSHMTDIGQALGVDEEIPCGSVGLKIGLIASGQADIYVEPGPYTSAWDACGPEAIIRGAGGQFTDITGTPLLYGAGNLKNTTGLLASNGALHDKIVQTLAPFAKTVLESTACGKDDH